MSVFNRSYLLTISSVVRTPPDPNRPYNLSVEEGFEGVPRSIEKFKVTELRISAKIEDTLTSENNKFTEIQIFNPTQEILAKLKKPNALITLQAGYSLNTVTGKTTVPEDLDTVFIGEVVDTFTEKQESDFVTTIRAKESEVARRDNHISEVYIGGQTIQYILEDIVTRYMPKIDIGQISLGPIFIPKQRLNNNYIAYGTVDKVLKELSEDFGFIYYFVDSKFYAQAPNYKKARRVVTIKPQNVIGDILPTIGTNNSSDPSDAISGLKFKVFLDGRITVERTIRIEGFDKERDGDYTIRDVAHVLDTRGEDWFTEITVEGI